MDEKAFSELLASVRWMKRHQAGKGRSERVAVVKGAAGLTREGLYKTLSDAGNPSFVTVT